MTSIPATINIDRNPKTFWEATETLMREKGSTFWKVWYVLAIDVPDMLGVINKKEPVIKESRNLFNLFKLSYAPHDLFKSVRSLGNHLVKERYEPKPDIEWSNWYAELIMKVTALSTPIADICEFTTKAIFYIPTAAFGPLFGINGCAMIVHFGNEGLFAGYKASNEDEFWIKAADLVKVAKCVCYVVLGACIALAALFAAIESTIVLPAWAFTTTSAGTVVASVIHFYIENCAIGDKRLKAEVTRAEVASFNATRERSVHVVNREALKSAVVTVKA